MTGNQYKDFEHAFAPYVRILGKGRKGSRALTEAEAHAAMTMILRGEVLDVQLGAFLMLLRVKEETGEEIAGFVRAARDAMDSGRRLLHADLDWASYAGKKNHLPWYLLAAQLLARNGIRILMHGAGGHTLNRVYSEQALEVLGIGTAQSFADAAARLERDRFAYLPLAVMSPPLAKIIDLRNVLGLRSPVHTLARLLNPADAPHVFHGIFHPSYRPIHQEAALLLGYRNLAVIKGEAGETERRPDAITAVLRAVVDEASPQGRLFSEEWPAMFGGRQQKEESLDLSVLSRVWRGEQEHPYGEAAVVGTAAMALQLTGRAATQEAAQALAGDWWRVRDRKLF
ncbi:MAG: glycosyl transferase family protein [Pseudomonadota bacterium]